MTGVICPHCGSGLSTVTDTRKIAGGIRRRRRCFKCSRTFVTEETARLAPLEETKRKKKIEPAVRISGGKRVDLKGLRTRRAADRARPRPPAEDDRVSRAWERQDGRDAASVKTAAEMKAMRAEKRRPRQELEQQEVDNPYFNPSHPEKPDNPKRVTRDRNLRESAIAVLASKGVLNASQVAAADLVRRYFEAMGGSGARGVDTTREFVDGGRFPEPIGERAINAGKKLAEAYEIVVPRKGTDGWSLVLRICGERQSIHDLTSSRRERDTMTDNLRAILDLLADHWGLSTKAEGMRRRNAA